MDKRGHRLLAEERLRNSLNLSDLLVYRNIREGRGDSVALLYQNSKFTYSKIADLVSRAAEFLRRHGLEPGDRCLMLLPDNPAFVVAFFAVLEMGGTVFPINPAMGEKEVSAIAVRAKVKLIFVDETLAGKYKSLDSLGAVIVTTGDCSGRRAEFEEGIELLNVSPSRPDTISDTAYCLFSSGTTGSPKGIPHRHHDIVECIKAYSLPVLGMSSNDRVLAVPKLTFGYGLGGNLLSSFYVGGTSILVPEAPCRESMLEAAARYKPTLFLGQPRVIADLLQRPPYGSFEHLRLAVSAGEVLASVLYQRWQEAVKVELLDGFGSTEVGHVFISNSVGDVRPGCAGRVLADFEVKILDDQDVEVPPNTIGHLWVRGPSLALEYWEDPERTRQHFRNGWVRTGDLFRQDAEGYLYACGRADDMIKAGCGQWVSPQEVESVLQEDHSVADCAVIGYSDEYGVVRTKAYVQLHPEHRPSADLEKHLKRMVSERWPEMDYKHLSALEFASELPRSSTGKLQRFRLRPATLTEFSYDC